MANKKAIGKRAKTRYKITASATTPTPTRLLGNFQEGDAVRIKINGAIHAGIPFRRFHGLTGKVIGKQGRAIKVAVLQGNQHCEIVVMPIHLKKVEQVAA